MPQSSCQREGRPARTTMAARKKRKHALVIGGTRGIGRAIAKMFAAKGHLVSVIGRQQPVKTDASIPNVHHWAVDLLDRERLSTALTDIARKNGKLKSIIFCQRYRGHEDSWTGDFDTSLT